MAIKARLGSNGEIGKRLLKVKEAARYLGLKVDTVYKKSRLRELPSVKVGRSLRILKLLRSAIAECGCSILLVHHRLKTTVQGEPAGEAAEEGP